VLKCSPCVLFVQLFADMANIGQNVTTYIDLLTDRLVVAATAL